MKQNSILKEEDKEDLVILIASDIGIEASTPDMVRKPKHYNAGSIEVINIIRSVLRSMQLTALEAFHTGQIIRYVCRWKNKGGIQDLEKAKVYLEWLIEEVNDPTKEY